MKKVILFLISLSLPSLILSQEIPPKTMILNSAISCKPNNYSTFMAIQKGNQAIAARQYAKALRSFEKAKEKDPAICDAWYLAGHIHNYQGNFELALSNSKKSVELYQFNYKTRHLRHLNNDDLK